MAGEQIERRLVAILMADVAGYSRLIGIDDEGTLAQLNAHHTELIEPKIKEHRGRTVRATGDGLLVLFVSAVEALRCAVEIQRAMTERNAQIPADRRIEFRMGVNVGDIVEGASIHGDGINVAARLEALADAGGVCVSSRVKEDAQGSLVRLGVAIEDIGQHQLKNIDHAVHIYRVLLDHAATTVKPKQAPTPAPALPDKPSIAVLPFANLSSDPEQEYLVDGIVEDIITELSRFSELFVIARNSSFQYKGGAIDVRQVGRELGVRYVLEGSVRHVGDRIRISAQLIDAATGAHRWADRYDRVIEDVFALQDEVARTVAGLLAAYVSKSETERTFLKPPSTWQAYDFFLRAADAFASYYRLMRVAPIYETRRLLDECLTIDPRFARAYVLRSMTHVTTWALRLDGDYMQPAALEAAHQAAEKAVQFDPNLPQAHYQLGFVLGFKVQREAAVAECERAAALNPSLTDWRFAAVLVHAGQPERAIEVAKAHLRVDPFALPIAHGFLGLAYYMRRRYPEAILALHELVSQAPDLRFGRAWLTAAYAQSGRLNEARAQASEILRIDPSWTITGIFRKGSYLVDQDVDHLVDGLRKAGLPET